MLCCWICVIAFFAQRVELCADCWGIQRIKNVFIIIIVIIIIIIITIIITIIFIIIFIIIIIIIIIVIIIIIITILLLMGLHRHSQCNSPRWLPWENHSGVVFALREKCFSHDQKTLLSCRKHSAFTHQKHSMQSMQKLPRTETKGGRGISDVCPLSGISGLSVWSHFSIYIYLSPLLFFPPQWGTADWN